MTMFREPVRDLAFIVSLQGGDACLTTGTHVLADSPIKPGTVMAEPDEGKVAEPFTGAVGQVVGGLLCHGVYADQVVAGGTVRRTILDKGPAEVTPQGGRMTFPVGADAAATAALREQCLAGLEARGIRVR